MLIDNIINNCNSNYENNSQGKTNCECKKECTHPSACTSNCELCLEQIHYPSRNEWGRKEYDCQNILDFYVCKYIHKYSSEIEYALHAIEKLDKLKSISAISLGCGASPDLVALENYMEKKGLDLPVEYLGIDINRRWKSINDIALEYFTYSEFKVKYRYDDVIDIFKNEYAESKNILILQYLVSHFYNTGRIAEVEKFYKRLTENVIKYMQKDSIIIINDVNSNNRGRDYFISFSNILQESGITHKYTKRYFDYNIQNEYQKYGYKYPSNHILTSPSRELEKYNPWTVCSSAQLIIEL